MTLGTFSNGGGGGVNTKSKSFTVNDAVDGTVRGIILYSETHAQYRAANSNEYVRFSVETTGNVVKATISSNHSINSQYYDNSMTVGAVYIAKDA